MDDPAPLLEIGAIDGDEPYVFSGVWDATRFEDGRLAVVDESGLEIRLFDAAGQYLLTFGGAGDGPAEFRGPPFVRAVGDATLLAWDGGHARLSWFDTGGRLLDQVTMMDALSEFGVFAFPNGRVWEIDALGNLLSSGPVRPRRVEGLRESFRRIALFQERGTVNHDFGQLRAGQSFVVRVDRTSIGVGNPYAPWTLAGLTGDGHVAIGDDTRWEVRIHGPTETLTGCSEPRSPGSP